MLVADDDPAVAWLVGGTLRAAGAVVTEAHDGARALELAYRVWPELVVSDVLMPGLDGFALCHALKRDVLLRDVPVVLLSWKEDLLFRLRDLGSDADGYLRKEAAASTVVRRVQELLQPRRALERRLAKNLGVSAPPDGEVRGRLDSMTVRQLLEIATTLDRPLRVTLRDATSIFDLRIREGSLKAATRTRNDGTTERGNSVLQALISVTAGRFSVTPDRDRCEPEFEESLPELLRPVALRARAAQRVLSGLSLGLVDRLVLEPDAFTHLSLLPLSLRHIAEELSRGIAPRQLLASGAASVHLLESLLADVARRGAVQSISSADGTDLLEQEMLALTAQPPAVPPKPAPAPTPLFTFQLSPSPPESRERSGASASIPPHAKSSVEWSRSTSAPPPNPDTWSLPSGTLSGVGADSPGVSAPPPKHSLTPALPLSKPPPTDDVDWAMELSWDDTPPPEGNSGVATSEKNQPDKPVTSGGFMRPSLPTPERRSHNETPNLANAVVKAVSQGTPTPNGAELLVDDESPSVIQKAEHVDARSKEEDQVRAPLSNDESATQTSDTDEAKRLPSDTHEHAASADAANAAREKPIAETASLPAERVETTAPKELGAAEPPQSEEATREPHAAIDPADTTTSSSSTHSPTPSPIGSAYAQKARSTTRFPNPSPGTVAPAIAAATAAIPITAVAALPHVAKGNLPGTRVTLPQGSLLETSTPNPAQTSPSTIEAAAPTQAESPAREGEARTVTPALPAVQKPPRPADLGNSSTHREYDSDPVFPLISAAPPAVDIQPAIEVGELPAPPTEPATSSGTPSETASREIPPEVGASTEATAREESAPTGITRDTLRSPGDSVAIAGSIPATALEKSAEDANEAASTSGAPPAHPAPPTVDLPQPIEAEQQQRPSDVAAKAASPAPAEPSRAEERPSAPAVRVTSASDPPQAHSVSWLQAVGLAFLAGAVTFAITVPVARWWRDRPSHSPAAAALDSASMAAAPIPSPANEAEPPPAPSASPSGNSTQPEAVIDEIPTPSDVTLAPGQALIEVVTAGGHAIFVDDTFVGRGPVRVVTVTPGKHQVRTRLNGIERRDWIEVGAGRSMRLSLAPTWK
ncbi:MAG: response regulator [Polyangiaceae bacterium]